MHMDSSETIPSVRGSPLLVEKRHLLDVEVSPSSQSGMVNLGAEFGVHDDILAVYAGSYETLRQRKRMSFMGRLFLAEEHICFLSDSLGRVIRICLDLMDVTVIEENGGTGIRVRTDSQTFTFTFKTARDPILVEMQKSWYSLGLSLRVGRQLRDSLLSHEDTFDTILGSLQQERLVAADQPKWQKQVTEAFKLPFKEALIDHFGTVLEEIQNSAATGRMFVTQSSVCFRGIVPSRPKPLQARISFTDITSIDKRSSGSIVIFTHTKKYHFSSFNDRKAVYGLLIDLWETAQPEEETRKTMPSPTRSGPTPPRPSSAVLGIGEQFMGSLDVADVDLPDDVHLDWFGFVVPEKHLAMYRAACVRYEKTLQKQRTAWSIFIANNDINKLIQVHAPVVVNVIKKGIPFQRRGELWYTFSGAQVKMKSSSTSYDVLQTKRSSYSKDIAKDIRRTFPYHPFYRKEENIKMLERVLLAYSTRNPAIGYCQSMNFIAAMLLLFLPEERAFWVLAIIVEDRLQEYFSESMIGTLVDQKVLVDLLREKLPRLAAHCDKHNLPLGVVTTKWFMCLFVGTLPTETALRVWDLFFFQGSPVIVSVSLAIFKLHEEELLKVDSTEKFMDFSNGLGKTLFDPDRLIKTTLGTIGVMDVKKLNQVRMRFWTTVESMLQEESKKRDMYFLQRKTTFSEAELEEWYRIFTVAEKRSMGTFSDCTPRAGPALGVEFEAFVDMLASFAPSWASEDADELMRALFDHLDCNSSHCVKFKDVVLAVNVISKGSLEDRLKLFFNAFAKDGKLSKESCLSLLKQLYRVFHQGSYSEEMQRHPIEEEQLTLEDLTRHVEFHPILASCLKEEVASASDRTPTIATIRTEGEAKPGPDVAQSPVARSPQPLTPLEPLAGGAASDSLQL